MHYKTFACLYCRILFHISEHFAHKKSESCERNKISCNIRKTIMQIVQNLSNSFMHFRAKKK